MALMRKDDSSVHTSGSKSQTHTLLGPESCFDGKLTFQGTVRIDGKFSGEILTDDTLIIGEGAVVDADVQVGQLVLQGTLRGNVVARKEVALQMPARMYGDLRTPSLTIHPGVIFEGNCRMENLDRSATFQTAFAAAEDEGDAEYDYEEEQVYEQV